ncbi:hypothetical protein [Kribbella lupini]|uniref:Uncharacterized protein n=1 Tax=Kribbella lupini TaxID=291602 RepID=A0ABN2C9A7_9ACTN
MSKELKVAFARPVEEPMLWLPDAVAGAVTAAVLGDQRWVDQLAGVITRYDGWCGEQSAPG